MTAVAFLGRHYVLRRLARDDEIIVARRTGADGLDMVESHDGYPRKGPMTGIASVACLKMPWRFPRRAHTAGLGVTVGTFSGRARENAIAMTRFAFGNLVCSFQPEARGEMIKRLLGTCRRPD